MKGINNSDSGISELSNNYCKSEESEISDLEEELIALEDEYAALESESKNQIDYYKNLLQNVPVGIYFATPGKIIWVNSYMERLTGFPASEILSWNSQEFLEHVHSDDFQNLLELNKKTTLNVSAQGELRFITKEGKYHWFHICSRILRYPNPGKIEESRFELLNFISNRTKTNEFESTIGNPIVLGVMINIDSRKKAESALKLSEEKYKNLNSGLPDLILLIRNNELEHINDLGMEYLGYSGSNKRPCCLSDVIPEEYMHRFDLKFLKEEKGCCEADIEVITNYGKRRLCRMRNSIIEIGDFELVLSNIVDMRDYRKTEFFEKFRRKFILLQDYERNNIAMDLSENAVRLLISALIKIKSCRDHNFFDKKSRIFEVEKLLESAIFDINWLSNTLHPQLQNEKSFFESVSNISEEFKRRTNICVTIDKDDCLYSFSSETNIQLYRIIQESLNNIEKHSGAKAVMISFKREGSEFKVKISDDGCGMKTSGYEKDRVSRVKFGLRNIKDRVGLLNGNMCINSGTGGTEIIISIPINASSTYGSRS